MADTAQDLFIESWRYITQENAAPQPGQLTLVFTKAGMVRARVEKEDNLLILEIEAADLNLYASLEAPAEKPMTGDVHFYSGDRSMLRELRDALRHRSALHNRR